ncbi:MAG TPA: peptidylprolyl isomerase [Thermoanaerobaculia bacterium]|jgi:parvulin-like peptidyl-prolyl isomerase|nr:peptidylprolyl isomerase [Thermoanaerobaculia bacterium]
MTVGRLAPAVLLLLTACQRSAPPPAPDAVARIGETEVRYSEFESYIARTAGETGGVLGSGVLSELFDQFLDERLLERLAVERKLVRNAAGAAASRQAIDALLTEGLRQEPGPGEVARYYQAHAQEFSRPERVKLRQILTEDQATAEKALKEIAAGTPFEEVARRLSRDPGAASGGYQGELTRADLPPAFAEVIFNLRPGEVSRLVPADYGVHIFQVVERQPAEVVPLEQARGEILGRLREERADRLLQSLVQDARRRYNVVIYERNLPFGYEGSYKESNAKTSTDTG